MARKKKAKVKKKAASSAEAGGGASAGGGGEREERQCFAFANLPTTVHEHIASVRAPSQARALFRRQRACRLSSSDSRRTPRR